MARQIMSEKNTRKIKDKTGLPIVAVLVRGGTNHRRDLCLNDGTIVSLFKDGTFQKTTQENGDYGHKMPPIIDRETIKYTPA